MSCLGEGAAGRPATPSAEAYAAGAALALARPLSCDSALTLFRQRRGGNGCAMLECGRRHVVAPGTVTMIVAAALLCAGLAVAVTALAAIASLVGLLKLQN